MADIVFPGSTPTGPLGRDMLPANVDIEVWRGDFWPLSVTVRDSGGTPMNLTGHTAQATIRPSFDSETSWDFITTIPTPTNGVVNLTLSSAISKTIPPGNYIWDFQITQTSTGNVRTYMAGDVKVYDEVTR